MRRRCRKVPAIAAAHRGDRVRGADQRRQRHVGGMRVADRVVLDRAQAKTLRGVVGRLLQPPIVEHQRFGLAVFQEQLAVVGARQPARDLEADGSRSRLARSSREVVGDKLINRLLAGVPHAKTTLAPLRCSLVPSKDRYWGGGSGSRSCKLQNQRRFSASPPGRFSCCFSSADEALG